MSNNSTLDQARAAKAHALDQLRTLPGMAGVGITSVDGGYGLKVNLSQHVHDHAVPQRIDGVPVVVERIGEIRKI